MKPRIAIPIPTTIDLPYNQRSWPHYATAITRSGGEPIAIDITLPPAEILALASTCHGVLLPGSPADVDPALYAAERLPECGPADSARETADRILLDDAEKNSKPVLAICYGLQFLNVWRGGSLIQDLAPLPVNHSAGSSVAIAHTAFIAPQSLLATLADPAETPDSADFLRLPINTSHHQSVAAPGWGLRIVARCPDDGVIEALELDPSASEHAPLSMFHEEPSIPPTEPKLLHVEQSFSLKQMETTPELLHVEQMHNSEPATVPISDHTEPPRPQFLLGVQWHPERSYDISPTSRALFQRLITEASLHMA